jgi:hypothetical protein
MSMFIGVCAVIPRVLTQLVYNVNAGVPPRYLAGIADRFIAVVGAFCFGAAMCTLTLARL